MLLLVLCLAGCGSTESRYPKLTYEPTVYTVDTRRIELKDGYVLNDGHSYDWIETEDGYDLVLHFKEDG